MISSTTPGLNKHQRAALARMEQRNTAPVANRVSSLPGLGKFSIEAAAVGVMKSVDSVIEVLRGLQRSANVLDGLYLLMSDAMIRVTSRGIIKDINPAGEALFKLKYAQCIGMPADELFGVSLEHLVEHAQEKNLEITLKTSEYEIFNALVTMTKIRHDPSETEYLFVVRDITETSKLKSALLANDLQIEALYTGLNESKDAVIITDSDNNIIFVNRAFVQHTGYELHEVVGRNPRYYSSHLVDRAVYDEMWRTLAKRETWQGSFINRHKDGRLLQDKTTITPIYRAGSEVATYYVAVKQYQPTTENTEVKNV